MTPLANSLRTARECISVSGARGASLGKEGMSAELIFYGSYSAYYGNVFFAVPGHAMQVAPPILNLENVVQDGVPAFVE